MDEKFVVDDDRVYGPNGEQFCQVTYAAGSSTASAPLNHWQAKRVAALLNLVERTGIANESVPKVWSLIECAWQAYALYEDKANPRSRGKAMDNLGDAVRDLFTNGHSDWFPKGTILALSA